MKPSNFPERKRRRQMRALDRLSRQNMEAMSLGNMLRRQIILTTLTDRVSAGSRRGVRTKKDRSANARLVRA